MLKLVLLIITIHVPLVFNEQEAQNMIPAFRFSTKNPYLFLEQQKFNYEHFRPRKIWAIYRHGTRLPGKKVISKYLQLGDLIEPLQNATILTDDEKSALRSWKPMNIKLEHQKYLTKEGEEELFKLGSRFRNTFFDHFDVQRAEFTFKHTPTQRTNLSSRKFIEGLFGTTVNAQHEPLEVARDDPVLRPYKGCPLWKKNVKKNPAALAEKKALLESAMVENLVNELRELTGIDNLDFYDIELIYTMCGFETAWRHLLFNGKSIWCSLFKNPRHMEIMEYLEDMEYYWIDGPGHEITRKVACKTVADMINQLDPSTPDQSLSFYFTHSGTILKLLTFLELYKDNGHLTAERIDNQRKWKTSIIDTFSSNIIAVLYDSEKFGPHVHLLHQERFVKVPNCETNEYGMCKFDDFKALYGAKVMDCNLSALCNVKEEL